MEIELLEVRDFLAGHPPFDALPAAVMDALPPALSIRYLRRGAPFPPADGDGSYLYVVRQGALEARDERDELVAKYAEGDLYSAACMEEPGARALRCWAVEDTLVYLLPRGRFEELRRRHPAFDHFFAQSLQDKLRRTVDVQQAGPALSGNLMMVDVGSLVSRAPVQLTADDSIEQAARLMTAERVSSVLVMREGRLEGIVTDRDLRQRCLAQAVPAQRPVRDIMTARVHTIERDAPAFEALLAMTRLGVHHLPVVERERVLGVVTTTDLVRHQSANAMYLARSVRRSASLSALAQASARLPELQIQMVSAGASPRHLGEAIGAVADAITQRLLELAEAELGPRPVPYAWIAFGSQARHEQTALSDQDNALLLSDDLDAGEHAAYFESLARFVCDGLHACGFPHCPGEAMASNPSWRQPLHGWRSHFDGWIDRPEQKAVMHVALFFDMRAVAGDAALLDELQAHVGDKLRGNDVFVARLVKNALHHPPPLGFFRNFVLSQGGEHADTFDLKRGGILPIVELARIYAMATGSTALRTVQRLHDAAERGMLSRAGSEDLAHALGFIGALRARHQVERMKRGLAAENHARPDELSLLERTQLKDAFAVVRHHQEALAQRYRARSFL